MTVILVSVDIYRSEAIGNLRSTSSDGDKLRRYFRDILGVPEERILELRDLAATREAIMTAIEGLLTNGTIRPGDRIVFYFAGHGTLVKAPTGWEAVSGNISMIVPSDCLAVNTAGKRIAPIPYRTLKALFGQLVRDKGVSVSVILDCCRSNSSLRQLDGAPLDWARMFSHENSFDLGGHCWIPADLDKTRWANDDGAQWASSQKQVWLMSCSEGENAYEGPGGGVFTCALIAVLQSITDWDASTLQYAMTSLPYLPRQHPHCEGDLET